MPGPVDPSQTTLLKSDELKSTRYGISKDYNPLRIDPYVIAASERVRSWVGDTIYDEALTAPDISALSVSEQRKILHRREMLKTVEGDLAMSYLTLNLNTYVTPEGQLLEAQAEGQTTHRYLTPEQCAKRAAQWFDQAVLLCEPFRVTDLAAGFTLQEIELCPTA